MTVESLSVQNPPYRMLGFTPTVRIEGLSGNKLEGVEIDARSLSEIGQISPDCLALLLLEIAGTILLLMGQNKPEIAATTQSSNIGDVILTIAAFSSCAIGPVANIAFSYAIKSRNNK